MNLAVISSLTSYSTAGYIIEALISEGHSIFVISDTDHPLTNCKIKGVFNLPNLIKQHSICPDFVFFIEGGSMQLFPNGLDEVSCLTGWYAIDTHMNYEKHVRISRLFDVTFVAQKEFVKQLLADGIQQVSWLPLACAPSIYSGQSDKRAYDISYVGSTDGLMHPERHEMLDAIQKRYSNTWIGRASPLEMGRVYSESKIVFNRSINNDVNMRIFEAMGAGSVLLTNEIINNGLEDLFGNDPPFFVYKNKNDLMQLLEKLLNNPVELEKKGSAAKKLVLNEHTYLHRVQGLVKKISSFTSQTQFSKLDYFAAFIAMSMVAPAFYCLGTYLKARQSTGVKRIVNLISALVLYGLAYILNAIDWIKYLIKIR